MKGSVMPKKQFTINQGEKQGHNSASAGEANLFSYENMRAEALKELNKGKNWDDEFKDLNEVSEENLSDEQ